MKTRRGSRREFLRGIAALAGGMIVGKNLAQQPRRRQRIQIGVQLYSVRDDCAKDLPGVLTRIAEMGYEGVEFAGWHGRTAEQLRQMLDERGLKCCGAHIGLESLLGDQLARSIEFHRTLGNPYLIVPGLPGERTASKQAWLETARLFNELADKVQPHGMWVGYHNHSAEFQPLEGELPWDLFFGNTKQEVIMQFDTGNAMHGGADPLVFLRRYPGRAVTVHLKEFSKTNPQALLGEGEVNWREILRVLRRTGGTKWYIIEQESYAYSPLECIDRCLKNLQALLARPRPAAG